ncbi:hypothetical protein [Helicobacter pullorum]|uniref:hypothetical protein n=1 Tax=Helicobacter pullorum TaxID=35818 RepID=UPI0015CF2399|nr:hypothetical protein [Helicobacter pullorum]
MAWVTPAPKAIQTITIHCAHGNSVCVRHSLTPANSPTLTHYEDLYFLTLTF